MSQHWGPPSYPPPRPPQYQPLQLEPGYYYEPESNTRTERILYFLAGSCSTLILVGCCVLSLITAWVVDTRLGLTTAVGETSESSGPVAIAVVPAGSTPVPDVAVTAVPGATPPTSNTPFSIGQPVIDNTTGTELIVLDIQRNVQPLNMLAAEGMEFVAVSLQLRDITPSGVPKVYQPENFKLQNIDSVVYSADAQADNGRLLRSGELAPGGVIEGDVLFHIPKGENPLFLIWQMTANSPVFSVTLQ